MIRTSSDSGTSLVELTVTLFITSIMSASLVAWISSASKAAGLHTADDVAVQELRLAKEQITRDLRVARDVLVAETATVAVWIDADEDAFQDDGEQVVWSITDDGLTRATDTTGSEVVVSGIDTINSLFTYDDPDHVTEVDVTLAAIVDADLAEPSTRTLTVEVHVRNAP